MQETQQLPSQGCCPWLQLLSVWAKVPVQLKPVSCRGAQAGDTIEFSFSRQLKKQNTTWHSTWPVCLLETPIIPTQIWLVQLGEDLELVLQGSALQFPGSPAMLLLC